MSHSAFHSSSNVSEVWAFTFSNALRRLVRMLQQQHRAESSPGFSSGSQAPC